MSQKTLPRDFPKITCLCGSTRFKDAFLQANRDETLAGRIVLSVGMFGHGEGLDMDGPVKAMLDELHLRKIDLATEVLVLNRPLPWCEPCQEFRHQCKCERAWDGAMQPYIGDSTRREVRYATSLGKPIRWLLKPRVSDLPSVRKETA